MSSIKSLLIFLIIISANSYAFEFEDKKTKSILSIENKLVSKLRQSSLEVLLPIVQENGGDYFISMDLDEKSLQNKVEEIVNGRWMPQVRSELIFEQINICKLNNSESCDIYDILFPNKALHVRLDNKNYFFVHEEIATNKLRDKKQIAYNNPSSFTDGDLVQIGLYSIKEQRLLQSSMTYHGIYSTTYRGVGGMISLASYWVFSSEELDEVEDFSSNSLYGCDKYERMPAPSPQGFGKLCFENNTLYIDGLINGALIEQAGKYLKNTQRLELNSSGGHFYSFHKSKVIKFASEVRKLGITTNVREGGRCGSLCTLLYQAGAKREAHTDSSFLYHGAQWVDKAREMQRVCDDQNENMQLQCFKLKAEGFELTEEYFNLLEAYDLDPQLKYILYSQPEDKDWHLKGNLIKKEDLIIDSEIAKEFNIVSE